MREEQGFSTVEALISLTIALVVLAGTMGAFNQSLNLNEKAAQIMDLEQNLRPSMNYLVGDFISAGWSIPVGGIPIPSGAGSNPVRRPGPPGDPITFNSQVIAAVNPGPALGPIVNGRATDIVNILYADNLLPLNQSILDAVGPNGSFIRVNAGTPISNINNPIRPGNLIALSNARGNALQYVTGVNGQIISFAAGDAMNLNQPIAQQGSASSLQNPDGTFPPTSAIRVWLVTFYIDDQVDPEMPRLIRQINLDPGNAIALVLEDLQLSYDIVDGAANPTNVKTPLPPNGPGQIRKANIQMSGRSISPIRETQ